LKICADAGEASISGRYEIIMLYFAEAWVQRLTFFFFFQNGNRNPARSQEWTYRPWLCQTANFESAWKSPSFQSFLGSSDKVIPKKVEGIDPRSIALSLAPSWIPITILKENAIFVLTNILFCCTLKQRGFWRGAQGVAARQILRGIRRILVGFFMDCGGQFISFDRSMSFGDSISSE